MSQIKREYSNYFTVPESKNKVREISRPVKITQLLGLPQNGEKNSAIKISLPERLAPHLRSSKKKKEANTCTKLSYNERKVRRNLNFTEVQATVETDNSIKTDTYDITEKLAKEKAKLCLTRKSFLLPPNTIKDLHIKSNVKQKKSLCYHSNIKINAGNKGLEIVRESGNCLSSVENSNIYSNSIICDKSNKTSVIQHTSRMLNINDQSGINILHSPISDLTDTSNDIVKKETGKNLKHDKNLDINVPSNEESSHKVTNIPDLSSACIMNTKMDTDSQLPDTEKVQDEPRSTNIAEEKCLSTNICEDLPLSLQVVKTINESCVNSQFNIKDNEYVILNKRELTNLASKLKLVICKLEQDMSNLKLTLATVTNALSTTDMTNKIFEVNEAAKQMTEHLNNNTEGMNNTNIKPPSCVMINDIIYTREDNILKEICKTPHIDLSKLLETDMFRENNVETPSSHEIGSENNKENEKILNSAKQHSKSKSDKRRCSARLLAKTLNKLDTTNDSFVNLENELCNVKSNITTASPENYTPVTDKYQDKKGGRPLKEYMALKSRMSCLLTPNIKRFNSMKSESDTHPESDGAKASLSNKILVELNNLYADSPVE